MIDYNKIFIYDKGSGKLFRRTTLREAKSIDKTTGYIRVYVSKGFKEYAQRIIWIMNNGTIPKGYQIDHINHIKTDNRLLNLRLVPSVVNCRNRPRNKNSMFPGVSWHKGANKWRVQIYVNYKAVHFGFFEILIDAVAESIRAHKILGYHDNHGR